jgi:hypothetical protein
MAHTFAGVRAAVAVGVPVFRPLPTARRAAAAAAAVAVWVWSALLQLRDGGRASPSGYPSPSPPVLSGFGVSALTCSSSWASWLSVFEPTRVTLVFVRLPIPANPVSDPVAAVFPELPFAASNPATAFAAALIGAPGAAPPMLGCKFHLTSE